MTIPIVMTPTGVQPQPPAALRDELVVQAAALSPGLTANLPGSLIEDMASTGAGALVVCDQAVIESVNNVTPRGANEFVLGNLGQIYGVQGGIGSNASVYVIFSGTIGFVINPGFTVSDGSHQYVVQDGGIVGSGGQSAPIYCVSTQSGTWDIPANTVTAIITSVPSPATLTCDNPTPGTPSAGPESVESYRSRVLQAGRAVSTGTLPLLRRNIQNITGVQGRLVSVRQAHGGYMVLVGGGDPYEIANAIFTGLFDINSLRGSVLEAVSITNANPGVVTTNLNHGYTNGQSVTITGALPGTFDGTYTATIIDDKSFSIGVDTSGFGAYSGDGVLTPNNRNQVVSIDDYPDSYDVVFVVPPLQTVSIVLVWNTSSTNVISSMAISQISIPVIASYINSIPVGLPINVFELQNAFELAIADIIPTSLLTRMDFTVSINGAVTPPNVGTGVINGDPESYFYILESDITVSRG